MGVTVAASGTYGSVCRSRGPNCGLSGRRRVRTIPRVGHIRPERTRRRTESRPLEPHLGRASRAPCDSDRDPLDRRGARPTHRGTSGERGVVLRPRHRTEYVATCRRTLRTRSGSDHHRVSSEGVSMSVTIAGIEFNNFLYDREADVLYLSVGEPRAASDFDASPDGDYLRFDERGSLFGVTIVNARHRFDRDGKIVITLPE